MTVRADDKLAADWHALMNRYHKLSRALDRELSAQHGLSFSEFEILQQLCVPGRSGMVRMNELGDVVHLSQSALSRLVTRLEADGLLERCACSEDRRSVILTVTRAGMDRYAEAKPTQRAILREHA